MMGILETDDDDDFDEVEVEEDAESCLGMAA